MQRLAMLYELARASPKAAAMRMRLVREYPRSIEALQTLTVAATNKWLIDGRPDEAAKLCGQILNAGPGPYAELGVFMMAAIRNEARIVRRAAPRRKVADVVCVAPDVCTYLAALSTWDADTFFPVLLADGYFTPRFINAFRPKRVIMLSPVAKFEISMTTLLRVVFAAWGPEDVRTASAGGPSALRDRYAKLGRVPLGAVVVDPNSDQLAGAVGLAAGHGEILVSMPKHAAGAHVLSCADMASLRRRLAEAIAQWGYRFNELGDDIDFVTVPGDVPYRYRVAAGIQPGAYAFDDALARNENERPWGYVGRLIGGPAQCVYAAMCSLFLQPRNALLFNTYGGRKGTIWKQYGMARAAKALQGRAGYSCRLVEGKGSTLSTWHSLTRPENRAGLVFVNSSGGRANWSVAGGGGTSDDIPPSVPALVEFTHSGSASRPTDPNSIAGRLGILGRARSPTSARSPRLRFTRCGCCADGPRRWHSAACSAFPIGLPGVWSIWATRCFLFILPCPAGRLR